MDSTISDLFSAIVATLKGGQTGAIVGSIFLVLTTIVYWLLKREIRKGEIDAAKKESERLEKEIRAADPKESNTTEQELEKAQESLRNNEQASLMKLLDSLPWTKLEEAAASKFGKDAVDYAIKGVAVAGDPEDYEARCRAAIYKFYGLV
jgi:membrane protein involved in colicin uptake